MSDRVIELAEGHLAPDTKPLIDFGLRYAGVLSSTPHDRIVRAVQEEVTDLVRRARAALEALGPSALESPFTREALARLASDSELPREALMELAARTRAGAGPDAVADELERWTVRHAELEHRVGWLLNGTPPERRETLDPHRDADELHHILTHSFRFEARVVEMLAVNRIAQSATIGTFFRSTKEAELNSVMRFFDTYALYANVVEWGVDSFRGRTAVARMNEIHGRYYLPNDGMKFVLLQGIFTWLDGVDRIGHRPVTDRERRGMTASYVRMGQAMNIQELTEDYEEMYAWYREVCEATREFQPYKRKTFETIVGASLSGQLPALRKGLFGAAQVAMDPTYLSATGYPEPTRELKQAVRAVFFTVGSLIEQLPYAPYLRSLANNPVRRAWTAASELGAPERSQYMPAAFAQLPNGGFPEYQKPLLNPGDAEPMDFPEISWAEVKKQAAAGRIWVVVDGYVYDLTTMVEVHPGGENVLRTWAGMDGTRAFRKAPHTPGTLTFSLNYRIGRVVGSPSAPLVAGDDVPLDVSAGI